MIWSMNELNSLYNNGTKTHCRLLQKYFQFCSIDSKPALYCSRFDLVEFQKSYIVVCVLSLHDDLTLKKNFYSNFTLKVIALYPSQTNNYLQTDPRKTKREKTDSISYLFEEKR